MISDKLRAIIGRVRITPPSCIANAAPNIDAACTGTVMRDYLRCSDLAQIPQDVIELYDDGTEANGELVYAPKDVGAESRAL